MENSKEKEIVTFVIRSDVDHAIHIVHLFSYPDSNYNLFKNIVDGYGNVYMPNIEIDKPLNEQRFWCIGRLLAIFDGRIYEKEVKVKLESTGFISDQDTFILSECSRDGIEFEGTTKDVEET